MNRLDAMDIFGTPVDEEEVPGYHSVIKNPMDLSTVRRKLEDLEYETLADMEVRAVFFVVVSCSFRDFSTA